MNVAEVLYAVWFHAWVDEWTDFLEWHLRNRRFKC